MKTVPLNENFSRQWLKATLIGDLQDIVLKSAVFISLQLVMFVDLAFKRFAEDLDFLYRVSVGPKQVDCSVVFDTRKGSSWIA